MNAQTASDKFDIAEDMSSGNVDKLEKKIATLIRNLKQADTDISTTNNMVVQTQANVK